jgi:hypothetical protein
MNSKRHGGIAKDEDAYQMKRRDSPRRGGIVEDKGKSRGAVAVKKELSEK